MHIRCRRNMFTDPLPRNGLCFSHISQSLRNNGCTRCSVLDEQ
jgi:hypothetical protein